MSRRAGTLVSEVVQPVSAAIDVEDHILKAVHAMVSCNLDLIPVTYRGRVVGVVRSVEVFRELAEVVVPQSSSSPE